MSASTKQMQVALADVQALPEGLALARPRALAGQDVVLVEHHRPLGLGDGRGVVGRAGVHDHDLVDQPGPLDQVAAQVLDDAADGRGLVAGRQADRDGQPEPLLGRAQLGRRRELAVMEGPVAEPLPGVDVGHPFSRPGPPGDACPSGVAAKQRARASWVPQLHTSGDASRGAEGPARRSPGNLLRTRKVPLPALPSWRGKMRRAVDRPRRDVAPRRAPEVDDRHDRPDP